MEDYLEQALQSKITSNKCKLCCVNLSSHSVSRQHCASKRHKNNVAIYLNSVRQEFSSSCVNQKNLQAIPQRTDVEHAQKHVTENVPKVAEKFYCYPCKMYVYSKPEKDKHVQSFPHVLLVKLKSVLLKEGIVEEFWFVRGSEVTCFLCNLMMCDSLGTNSHINSIKHRHNYNNWCKHLPPCKVAIDIRWYYCKICDKDLDGTSESERHYSSPSHSNKGQLYCRTCQVPNATPELLEAHKSSSLHMEMLQKSQKPIATCEHSAEQTGRGAPIKSCDSGTNKTERNPEALNTDLSSTPKQGKQKANVTTDLKFIEKNNNKAVSSQQLLENALYFNSSYYRLDANISDSSKPTEKRSTSSTPMLNHSEENSNTSAVSNATPELLEAHVSGYMHMEMLQKSQKPSNPIATWEQSAEQSRGGFPTIKSDDSGRNKTERNPEPFNSNPSSTPKQSKEKTNITTHLESLGKRNEAVGSQQLMENAISSISSHNRLDVDISKNSKSMEKSSTTSQSSMLNCSAENSNTSADSKSSDISISSSNAKNLQEEVSKELELLVPKLYYLVTVPYEVALDYLKRMNREVDELSRKHSSVNTADAPKQHAYKLDEPIYTNNYMRRKEPLLVPEEFCDYTDNAEHECTDNYTKKDHLQAAQLRLIDTTTSKVAHSLDQPKTANLISDSEELSQKHSSSTDNDRILIPSDKTAIIGRNNYSATTIDTENGQVKNTQDIVDLNVVERKQKIEQDYPTKHSIEKEVLNETETFLRQINTEEVCDYTDKGENECKANYTIKDNLQPAQLRLVHTTTSAIVHNLDQPNATNCISESKELSSSSGTDSIFILSDTNDKAETLGRNNSLITTIDTENGEDRNTPDTVDLNNMGMEKDCTSEDSIEKEVLDEMEIFLRQIGDGEIPLEEILRYLESVNEELQMNEFAEHEVLTGEDEKGENSEAQVSQHELYADQNNDVESQSLGATSSLVRGTGGYTGNQIKSKYALLL